MMAARYALMAIASAAVASAQSLTDNLADIEFATTTRSTSAFWTATVRYAEQVTESPYTYGGGSVVTDTYTRTRTLKDKVTPTASPYSVTTSWDYYYSDVEVVAAYYTTGVVAESDFVSESTYDAYSTATTTTTITSKIFSMPVIMTAPASCPTPFTVTTSASVTIPAIVTPQISPSSVSTGTSDVIRSTVLQYETWYLTAGAAPFHSSSDYYYDYYIASCSTPPISRAYPTGTNSRTGDSISSDDFCYSYYCGTPFLTYVIIIASIIPGLFLLGFAESWFWFRRLMMGKSAMRFGTVCWVFISLWVLCFTRMQDRRSAEDQKLLTEKWKSMSRGAAFKAWWKWGFRHRYPEELLGQFSKTTVGIVPPGQPLYPAMAQTPGAAAPAAPGQVYYYGPPPPGWIQAPNGGFMPPQGSTYPPPQQGGVYGDAAKDGSLVSHSPVSIMGYPPPSAPQAPQPVHSPQDGAYSGPVSAPPSPPPQGPLPIAPPQIPSVNVSEAPANTPAAPPPPKNDAANRDLYQ